MKILKILLFLSIVITGALAFYFKNEHPHFIWQKIPVYDTIFGLVGSLVAIIIAKTLGHFLLQKEEDYYDK